MKTELQIISEVIGILGKTKSSRSRYAHELDNFRNRAELAKANKYRFGVIGVTSSGKSTMINALLGESLLPSLARPSSSQLVSCCKSNDRKATIIFLNGKAQSVSGKALTPQLIGKYADEGINHQNKEQVKQLELSSPAFPFDENIVLIDSPGLDAYGYEGHEQLTMNSLLPTIDFCLFITTCKTNSDDKMLSVLNTIADYDKPVIIVQNMIDSLKPSLDGKKSVVEVAQEHRVRVERIISKSAIRDKSKVRIVQISAIKALQARANGLRSADDIAMLEKSCYQELVEAVKSTFGQVRPIVEGHRLQYLKKEILRIATAAKADGKDAHNLIPKFEYEGLQEAYETSKNEVIDNLAKAIDELDICLSELNRQSSFSEADVDYLKSEVGSCEQTICEQMKKLNRKVVQLCNKLNIDSRSILQDFRMSRPSLLLKTKKQITREAHYERIGDRDWKWLWLRRKEVLVPAEYEYVTDVPASIKAAETYLRNSMSIFVDTIEKWKKSVGLTEESLFAEIENRRKEYEARKKNALAQGEYLEVGEALSRLAGSINIMNAGRSNVRATATDVKRPQLYKIEVEAGLLSLCRMAEQVRLHIQMATFRPLLPITSHTIVLGWDEYCESKLAKYAFGVDYEPSDFKVGMNRVGQSTCFIHKSSCGSFPRRQGRKNLLVLVNATQYGAALKELTSSGISDFLSSGDQLCLVVQDFQEIINGGSVEETLANMKALRRETKIRCHTTIAVLHDNPIYNLALQEAQITGCTHQTDEIRIINRLQERFSYLYPADPWLRNLMEYTIRTIIQTIGKI